MAVYTSLIMLFFYHFIADYILQSDTVAKYKNYHNPNEHVPWYYWMIAHASIHAIGIYYVTGMIELAICEVILHFLIDWGKCAKKYGIHTDQLFHILCKGGYIIWLLLV